ncbi:hypothetical protein MANY_45280 [Mycolicibacterium anyangense]|uniref:Uncharacterized protein n=1 Tax=Mycolicibacterium anyangense TaxID=1431246 RepID=A0A6N4WJ48_9MYCO|nr:hypothetical protein [Mycolicibacterium anyangense]BBZ79191.1 hypothetical protein MANY_45280 [Mycolicibacterium anyangense]
MSDFSFVWSGEPGIDLLSQPAVVVRAYLESVSAASAAGSNDYLYPGFQSAVAKTVSKDPSNYSMDLWPELHYPWTQPTVGTSREHILRVTEDALRTTAVICHFGWGVARKGENGFYAASAQWDGAMTGVGAFRLSLKAPASSATRGLRPQQGPSPAALTDTFGGWRVVAKLSESSPSDAVGPGTQWPEFAEDLAACAAKAPESEERRQFLTTGEHPRSDFPTLPAYPGWPAESQ